jgi:hypothetical protein
VTGSAVFQRWFAVLTIGGEEHRIGPYATRKMAERMAAKRSRMASDVEITYEHQPPKQGR